MGWLLAGLELERGAERWAPAPTSRGRAVAAEVAKRVAQTDGLRGINAAELRAMQARQEDENLYVFDVRTTEEYAAGHVAGAGWAPGGQAVQAIDDYLAVRGAQIVFVCDDGSRAALSTAWYKRLGFPRIAYLEGGLPAWQAAGGALESGHPIPAPWGLEAARQEVAAVTPGDLGGAVVISVDPSDVYLKAHVPGATWICRSRLERKIGAVVPEGSQALVVTCADGVQSAFAAATLARLGYAKARVLAGGVRAWQAAGRPIETGPTRLADETDDVVLKPYERGRAAMEARRPFRSPSARSGWPRTFASPTSAWWTRPAICRTSSATHRPSTGRRTSPAPPFSRSTRSRTRRRRCPTCCPRRTPSRRRWASWGSARVIAWSPTAPRG